MGITLPVENGFGNVTCKYFCLVSTTAYTPISGTGSIILSTQCHVPGSYCFPALAKSVSNPPRPGALILPAVVLLVRYVLILRMGSPDLFVSCRSQANGGLVCWVTLGVW